MCSTSISGIQYSIEWAVNRKVIASQQLGEVSDEQLTVTLDEDKLDALNKIDTVCTWYR